MPSRPLCWSLPPISAKAARAALLGGIGGLALMVCPGGCISVDRPASSLTRSPWWSLRGQAPELHGNDDDAFRYNPRSGALVSRAIEQYRRGQLEAAQLSLQSARRIDPYCVELSEFEMQIAADLGKTDEQVTALRAVVAANPQSARHQNWAGKLLVQAGDPDAGIAALRQAIELSPRTPRYAQDLAAAHVEQGQADQAVRVLETALARNRADASLAASLARLHESHGRWESAAAYYEVALRFDSQNTLWRRNLARALYHSQQFSRACETFARCEAADGPSLSPAEMIEYCDACLQIDDFERAQRVADRLSAQTGGRLKQVEALRGLCALKRGDAAAAREILDAALAAWPHDPLLSQVVQLCR